MAQSGTATCSELHNCESNEHWKCIFFPFFSVDIGGWMISLELLPLYALRPVTESRSIPFNCLLSHIWFLDENTETKINVWLTHYDLRLLKKEREPIALSFMTYAFRKVCLWNSKYMVNIQRKLQTLGAILALSEVLEKFAMSSLEYGFLLET